MPTNARRRFATRRERAPLPYRLRLVHEDDDVLVVDKPAGLLTMATATERERTAYAAIRGYLGAKRPPEKVFIVHRLDRDVSGLVVFAKSPSAKTHLQAQFQDHSAGRRYVALVDGVVREDSFSIRSRLAENAALRVYSSKGAGGRDAVTHVRVLGRRRNRTLVQVRLETGRKHQIRVHLAERGHPVSGDDIYGSRTRLPRIALHGASLEFTHPESGERRTFESRFPAEFNRW